MASDINEASRGLWMEKPVSSIHLLMGARSYMAHMMFAKAIRDDFYPDEVGYVEIGHHGAIWLQTSDSSSDAKDAWVCLSGEFFLFKWMNNWIGLE